MSSQTPNITNTPQQIADAVAASRNARSFATGQVTIAILVHNEENEVLVHNNFDENLRTNGSLSLTLVHLLCHEIDLKPFVPDHDAETSVKALAEDAIISRLGIVDIKNMTVLHVCGHVNAARVFIFVACSVDSSEVPNVLMGDLRWLPESVLQDVDLKASVVSLGADGVRYLWEARDNWKQEITSIDTLPDLVSDLPAAASHTVQDGGSVDAEQDTGYQPDSLSSTGSVEANETSDVDEDYTLEVEEVDDDLPDLVSGDNFVFGNGDLPESNAGKRQQQLTYYRAAQRRPGLQMTLSAEDADSDGDDDTEDLDHQEKRKKSPKSEKAARRVFQLDPAMIRGSRVPRKQQMNPPLMVDPSYLHLGPRFARPAQKVDGRRFRTKVSRTKISIATDRAITQSKVMWEELRELSPEVRQI
ncbi:hypothetical protein SMMN14_04177 [Sphaerulina musiva]